MMSEQTRATPLTEMYSLGARRFGSARWSGMYMQLAAEWQKQQVRPLSAAELLENFTWATCMQAWGPETAHGADKHCTRKVAGVIIWHGDRMALQERLTGACGFAPSTGHLEASEDAREAVIREAYEEMGITLTNCLLMATGRRCERCKRYGSDYHDWSVFEAYVESDVLELNPDEAKQIAWYEPYQVLELARRTEEYLHKCVSEEDWRARPGIEVVWYWWMRELGVLSRLAQFCGAQIAESQMQSMCLHWGERETANNPEERV